MIGILNKLQDFMDALRKLDFLAPLALRAYLVPVFWVAGNNKWNPFADGGTLNPAEGLSGLASWFGDGLGLPLPLLMAFLAWAAEYFGSILLALGLAVRWIAIPLMITMVVAATTVHWENGWQAVHDAKSPHASANVEGAAERLERAKSILRQHGNYRWLTEEGSFVVSNNGIEWAATYFAMLLSLWALGGGRFFSVDYWLKRRFRNRPAGQG